MSNFFKKHVGAQGEASVEAHLIKNGFTIVRKNFSIRGGEIDIIAHKNDVLAFVEVKTRTTAYFNISEVITPSKQKKIILAAKYFIAQQPFTETSYRFDVALVDAKTQRITYIENAFCDRAE